MDPQLEAAAPLLVTAILALLASGIIGPLTAHAVERHFEANPHAGGSQAGYEPADLGSLASWACDKYQALTVVVVVPILGLMFAPGADDNVTLLAIAYAVASIGALAMYSYIARSDPASYATAGQIRILPKATRPILEISFGSIFVSAVLAGGGILAYVVTPNESGDRCFNVASVEAQRDLGETAPGLWIFDGEDEIDCPDTGR